MSYRVSAYGYFPRAEAFGLSDDEYPDGVGFLMIEGDTRVTRVGSPEAVMTLDVRAFKSGADALNAFPLIAQGWPQDWPTSDSPRWLFRAVA